MSKATFYKILILLITTTLSGCYTHKPDANYTAYIESVREQARQDQAKWTEMASMASECHGDARCVEHVASVTALAQAGGGNRLPAPEQYRPQQNFAQQLMLGLVGNIAPLANAAVNWHQADKSTEVSIAQYRYLDHVLSNAVTGLANSQPNINVQGDMLSGQSTSVRGHVGNTTNTTNTDITTTTTTTTTSFNALQDLIFGNKHIGDINPNSGIIHNGDQDRYTSPGPIDDHQNNGCQNSDCSTPPPNP